MDFYSKHYKKLIILPLTLFIIFLFLIIVYPKVPSGIDFSGGTVIQIKADKPMQTIRAEEALKKFELSDLRIKTISSPLGYGLVIEFAEQKQLVKAKQELALARSAKTNDEIIFHASKVLTILNEPINTDLKASQLLDDAITVFIKKRNSLYTSIQETIKKEFNLQSIKVEESEKPPVFGKLFWNNALFVGLMALIFIIITVLLFFRKLVPSFAIIAAAIFDISSALALMAVFNVDLSLASIPALLMLVGYSIDTDVMLTTRLLKSNYGDLKLRINQSLITGLTMTSTTLAALIIMLLLSYFLQLNIVFQIAAVLFFGLMGDIISTWFMNAPVLLFYLNYKG